MGMRERYFVPDLTPRDRPQLKGMRVRCIFVAESPHVSEIEPQELEERRPLCGVAGREWWGMLSQILEGASMPKTDIVDVSLKRMLKLCRKHGIAVMNAVQYPLDPGIATRVAGAAPMKTVGFTKLAGENGYKQLKSGTDVRRELRGLADRLGHPGLSEASIFPLGLDAEWFVRQALGKDAAAARMGERVPHPSAWWRQGGHFRQVAREKLERILDECR